ncbi:Carboxyl-terminal protease [Snodgrassella communis]|uniref:Peptidase S41 n=1 Tax=Snodgrassella alvi TaxID=1196083 RepID=A0A066TLB4_9NEIS|nr:S41 family peptidase [Snodgrassella communis]KDN12863.1 Carboxyl-terminal protease [Snodgrassella communis]PIT48127.1 peptidase S41 [Snodgrassella communis]
MAKSRLKKAALYTLGAFSGMILTLSVQGYANEKSEALPVRSLHTMAEVYGQIKANYVENKTDDAILEGAMKGMVNNLDPHSEYLTGKDYTDLQESTTGEFGGLGMEISSEDGLIKIVAPIEDTPADRAGIKSGDYIVKINNESTRNMTATEAVKKMRGKPGTSITLTLARKDETQPIVVHLTRAIIKVKSVRYKLLEPDYGYVRITQFQEHTVSLLADAIKNLEQQNKQPLKGLVLDLRDDPGGLLNSAVGVSAVFLKPGVKVVSTKNRDKKEGMVLKAIPKDYVVKGSDPLINISDEMKTIPITVLVNSGTASASEIVSGALQDYKRAVIVGTQSFGKGSVQTVIPLSNGGAVKLTTALYYTPNDRSIQAQGIVPDVEVKDKNRKFESREADLGGHLSNPLGGKEVNGELLSGQKKTTQPTTASEPAIHNMDDNADKASTKDTKASTPKNNKKKDEDDWLTRREPNPAKDEQLKTALDLVKDPVKWNQSLGLAAKKPAKATDKKDKK